MIRVLVADDNDVVRRGLVSLLAEADGIAVVGEAGDGDAAIAEAARLKPDIALLDVQMPGRDGIYAAAQLVRQCKVVMVTYSDAVDSVVRAVRAGASGYLVHGEFDTADLGLRLRQVLDGHTIVSPSLVPVVFEALRRAPAVDDREAGPLTLTPREREIMNFVAQGLPNAMVGERLFLSERTIKNHLTNVYGKLGVHSRAEAIVAWLGVGSTERARA